MLSLVELEPLLPKSNQPAAHEPTPTATIKAKITINNNFFIDFIVCLHLVNYQKYYQTPNRIIKD